MTLHEGSAKLGAPESNAAAASSTSSATLSTTTASASAATTTTTTTTTPASPITSNTNHQQQQQTTDSSEQPTQQNNEQDSKTTIKQFSDKSLEELAQYYLNLEPANIPDLGFVVSGIAGRFPNADNLNELWENLLNGRDMVLGPDDKRWPLGKFLSLPFSYVTSDTQCLVSLNSRASSRHRLSGFHLPPLFPYSSYHNHSHKTQVGC